MIYEAAEQRLETKATIGRILAAAEPDTHLADVKFVLGQALSELVCRMKHPAPLLPITEVIVGPCRDQEKNVATAQALLEQHGYRGLKVTASAIPFSE